MKDLIEKLREFHRTYNLPIGKLPHVAEPSLRLLRVDLMLEEVREYFQAEKAGNLAEIADGLIDVIYIAVGTGIAYGLPMEELFNEVHRSNMSKLGADGKAVYSETGKVLKGPFFSPPNLVDVLLDSVKGEDR